MTMEDINGMKHSSEIQQTIVPNPVEEYEEKTVGFWMRFFAFIIDQAIVSAVIGIVVYPIFQIFNWSLSDVRHFAPITIISTVFYYSYFILMTKYFGQTLGKMIFGLKVQKSNGQKLDWSTVIFRELIGRFINNTVWVLYLLVIFMPKNNSLADYFADTIVIQENVYVKKNKDNAQPIAMNTQVVG
jgi:uncharacterized RDD family membrane protein YckC